MPPRQQTRVAAFLISAHGALARQLALALPAKFEAGWQTELNAQLYREAEIVSLLLRATSWVPDPALLYAASWEAAWLPKPNEAFADRYAWRGDRPRRARRMPSMRRSGRRRCCRVRQTPNDPFAMALRRIEFESGRLMQAQIMFLKSADLLPFRDAVNAAVESRHAQVRKFWTRDARRHRRESSTRIGLRAALMQIKGARLRPAASMLTAVAATPIGAQS